MYYNNIMSYYPANMYGVSSMRSEMSRPAPPPPGGPRPPMGGGNRPFGGGFLLPFALGFVSSPLIFGATRPRPMYGPYPGPYPYYPYY